MFFPEALYLLSARDQQVTWLDPVLLTADSTPLLQTTITANVITVRTASALLLQSAIVRGSTGGAQNLQELRLDALSPGGNLASRIADAFPNVGAGFDAVLGWQGSIVVPPGWIIRGVGVWDAGAVANQVICDLQGLLIPIANIQRV